MSGNYDYPPASRRGARGSRPSDRPHRPNGNRLQHLRDLLNSERNRNNSSRAIETFNQEIDEYRSGRVRDQSIFEQTRAFVDQQILQLQAERIHRDGRAPGGRSGPPPLSMPRLQPLGVTVVNPNSSEPSRSVSRTPRARAARGGDRPSRSRRNRDPNLPSILDQPIPRLDPPTIMPQEPDNDLVDNRLRAKRRKLDTDDNREGPQSFRYGQYGQVVPGTLKMELASCDGGSYETESDSSWPENILRNDSSVYCTKSDRCNLILKHRGETPFCLKKLVIKAPKTGYDAPIQAGMVFVSMSSDELLAHTAQYQIQYAGSRRHRGHRRNGIPPSQEYFNSYRTPLQTLERTSFQTGPEPHSDSETDTGDLPGPCPGNAPEPTAEFRITTDYDERSERGDYDRLDDESEMPSLSDLERLQMVEDDLYSESDDSASDDDDDTSETNSFHSRRRDLQRQVRAMRRQYAMDQEGLPRRRPIPSTIQPIPPAAAPSSHRGGSSTRLTNPGLMKPLAQFFIKRHKSSVSLKFDPPPSGRYILIKLWSPYNAGNIDIQSIIAHGFAGPRFFPASGVR